jgi:hypothetical protein
MAPGLDYTNTTFSVPNRANVRAGLAVGAGATHDYEVY